MDFGVDTIVPAVVAIDLHRGHLDGDVATMPLEAEASRRLVAANRDFNNDSRKRGIQIVHLVTNYRDVSEIRSNPFWRTRAEDPSATRSDVERHNLEGSPGTEIIPELYDAERDWAVRTKKRYDCFIGTDLDFVLRKHGVNTLMITGVNTNSCVLSTVAAACSRDYAVIVIENCVATMDGPALHDAALLCMRTALGWVMTGDKALAATSN